MAVGEEANVADAVEAVGQGVQEEAPDELVRGEPHELGGAFLAIVLPGEGDVILVAGDEPAIGDGDPMSVAAEIGQHLSRSAEGLLGVDDPVDPPQGDEMAREPVGIGEPCEAAEEAQPSFGKGGGERNSLRNRRASGFTARKKFALLGTQLVPSLDSPPPGTTQ